MSWLYSLLVNQKLVGNRKDFWDPTVKTIVGSGYPYTYSDLREAPECPTIKEIHDHQLAAIESREKSISKKENIMSLNDLFLNSQLNLSNWTAEEQQLINTFPDRSSKVIDDAIDSLINDENITTSTKNQGKTEYNLNDAEKAHEILRTAQENLSAFTDSLEKNYGAQGYLTELQLNSCKAAWDRVYAQLGAGTLSARALGNLKSSIKAIMGFYFEAVVYYLVTKYCGDNIKILNTAKWHESRINWKTGEKTSSTTSFRDMLAVYVSGPEELEELEKALDSMKKSEAGTITIDDTFTEVLEKYQHMSIQLKSGKWQVPTNLKGQTIAYSDFKESNMTHTLKLICSLSMQDPTGESSGEGWIESENAEGLRAYYTALGNYLLADIIPDLLLLSENQNHYLFTPNGWQTYSSRIAQIAKEYQSYVFRITPPMTRSGRITPQLYEKQRAIMTNSYALNSTQHW